MSEQLPKTHYRRILVALDASPQSLAALKTARRLAESFGAELVGIFVEDINLVRMANMPFAREVGNFSARVRQIDSPALEHQLRAHAHWIQEILQAEAQQARLPWRFETKRGSIRQEILHAAAEADLLVLGKTGWSRRKQLGSTARYTVVEAPSATIIVQQTFKAAKPIIVLVDGSELSQKALELTEQLAGIENSLLVYILAKDVERAKELRAQVEAGQKRENRSFRWIMDLDAELLTRLLKSDQCGLLFWPYNPDLLERESFLRVLDESECAVWVVR